MLIVLSVTMTVAADSTAARTLNRPTRQRVLDAVRTLFRQTGSSPSHSEIAEAASIAAKRVQRYVELLSAEGFLSYRKRVARSIVLVDRGAMLSDAELRLANAGRGWVVQESAMPALAAAYPVPAEPDEFARDILRRLVD